MTLTDKTGAPVTVHKESDKFTIAVDGKTVGSTAYTDTGGSREFPHTEVDDAYGGRGLATIVIGEALAQTRSEGLRIVPTCTAVASYIDKHSEYADIVDRPE
jgi:predicted GNAT family acetyltransferase